MTTAPGLLDQRLRIYRFRENVTGGVARPTYEFVAERWGRIDTMADVQTVPLSPQAHAEYRGDARGTVMEGTEIPAFGLITVHGNIYRIRGVVAVRQLRRQQVTLQRITPDEFATFVLYDEVPTTDGTHLIDPEPDEEEA